MESDIAQKYRLQIIEILYEMKSYKDCAAHCKHLLNMGESLDLKTKIRAYNFNSKVILIKN